MNKVAHASLIFFRFSENWIYTQLKYLKNWQSLVLTNETANLDSVEWKPSIYSRKEQLSTGLRLADSLAKRLAGYYPSFYWQAKKADVNLIHAHFGTMGFWSSPIAEKLNIPLVTSFYGYDASMLPHKNSVWKGRYQKLFERGTKFLVEGSAMKKKLEALGCASPKINVHHLGVETEKFAQRSTYPSEKKLNILMVGRFVEKKGFIYGIKGFHQFLEQGGEGTLTIVGDAGDSSCSKHVKRELKAYVKKHDLAAAVNFPGIIPLKELRKQYYEHNLFLSPSVKAESGDDEGGAPVTILEAASTGMPAIGSRHCDIPEVIEHGKSGFIFPEEDITALAHYLIKYYEDPELRKKMGQFAAQNIRESFDARKQGIGLAEIYEECMDEFS